MCFQHKAFFFFSLVFILFVYVDFVTSSYFHDLAFTILTYKPMASHQGTVHYILAESAQILAVSLYVVIIFNYNIIIIFINSVLPE